MTEQFSCLKTLISYGTGGSISRILTSKLKHKISINVVIHAPILFVILFEVHTVQELRCYSLQTNAYYDLVPAITSQNFQLKFNKFHYTFI